MKRVAIVVQRCHQSVVGGSEALAWQYATLLCRTHAVDVLTTTALDITTWANALPEGVERREDVRIHRFPVTKGRDSYWYNLHTRLLKDFEQNRGARTEGTDYLPWSIPLQEEFIRRQGPFSAPLLKYLKESWKDYASVIFVTYLYPTTYFGLFQVPVGRALIVPTLHDEPPAYLSAYKYMTRRARGVIWLTEAERRLGRKLWGDVPGRVVSMSIDASLREPAESRNPFLLYCGRIDPNKGCSELFQYFLRFKKEFPSTLKLVLTGQNTMELPADEDIEFRGFVDAEEKFRLMAGAMAFVMPSRNESFSIVTLEAMAQRTPVLASGLCEVLVDHIRQSRAGHLYKDYESFAAALQKMLSNGADVARMRRDGREYILSKYGSEEIQKSLIEAVEAEMFPQSES